MTSPTDGGSPGETGTDGGDPGGAELADRLSADPEALRAYIEEQRERDAEIDAFLAVAAGAAKRIAQSAEGLRSR